MSAGSKLAVIGDPVAHSLSPLIHNYWIRAHGLFATYEAVEIRPDDLQESVAHMVDTGYIGFNVTIPHKQAIMSLCDDIDATAEKIGAVNTVCVRDGKLTGTNTDSFGFAENIRAAIPDFDGEAGCALVLGAGGAARAVVHALRSMGMNVLVANRTREKSEALASDFHTGIIDWGDRVRGAEDIGLLVNTTSLGMSGQGALDFDMKYLPNRAVVCDIVYKPLMTPFLQQAQQRGNRVVTGIGMLLHQARPAFREWFGVMPEVTVDLEEKILERAT